MKDFTDRLIALAEKGEYEHAIFMAKRLLADELDDEIKQEALQLIEVIETRIKEKHSTLEALDITYPGVDFFETLFEDDEDSGETFNDLFGDIL